MDSRAEYISHYDTNTKSSAPRTRPPFHAPPRLNLLRTQQGGVKKKAKNGSKKVGMKEEADVTAGRTTARAVNGGSITVEGPGSAEQGMHWVMFNGNCTQVPLEVTTDRAVKAYWEAWRAKSMAAFGNPQRNARR